MKEIIFQQSIVIDPYEEYEYEQYTIDGVDISLLGSVENNFVKRRVESLFDKLGYDMYDDNEYEDLTNNTLVYVQKGYMDIKLRMSYSTYQLKILMKCYLVTTH